MSRVRGQKSEVGGRMSAVIVGGPSGVASPPQGRPEGWAVPIAEMICDLFGVVDRRSED
jgi:hypothetical protein